MTAATPTNRVFSSEIADQVAQIRDRWTRDERSLRRSVGSERRGEFFDMLLGGTEQPEALEPELVAA